MPGQLDPLPGEPARRAEAGLLAEPPGEGAHAGPRVVGQLLEGPRPVQVVGHPGPGGRRPGAVGVGDRAVDELGLATVPPGRHHPAAGHPGGRGAAVVAAQHVQQQVDARRVAGAGEHVAVVDVEHVGVQPHLRVQPGEPVGVQPVGGGGAAVEAAGRGQHERPGADRHQPRRPLQGRGDAVGQLRRVQHRAAGHPGDDDGPGTGQQRQVAVGQHPVPRTGGHRAAVDGGGDDLVQRGAVGALGAAEEGVRQPELEGHDVLQREDDDPVQRRHGRILAHVGLPATGRPASGRRCSPS